MNKSQIIGVASQISPISVRDYAKFYGWVEEQPDRPDRRFWLFNHPKIELRQLIIPMEIDDDWGSALYEIILRLSEDQNQDFEIVLDNLMYRPNPQPKPISWDKERRRLGISINMENFLVIASLIIILWPVGLYYAWTNRQWSKKTKWIWTGFWVAWILLYCILSNSQGNLFGYDPWD